MITQAEFVALLREQATPNQKALAGRIGIKEGYLSDVLNGRRDPGKTILAALGYERVVLYRKIGEKESTIDRTVRRARTCTACGGSGIYDAEGSPPCGACDGTGVEYANW